MEPLAAGRGGNPPRAGGGIKSLSKTWFGGPERWPRGRGRRKCHGRIWLGLPGFCGEGAPGLPGSPCAGHAPPARGKGPGPAQSCGAGRAPLGNGDTAVRDPRGAMSLPPPLGGTRVRWPINPPVLRSSPRGDAVAYAPRAPLPGHMGPAPADACPHTAIARRPLPHGLPPPPPRGTATAPTIHQEAPTGAALERPARGPATQPPTGARCAWSTGHPRAPGAKAWGGASSAVAAHAMRGTTALRRARGARRQRLGLRRAAKFSSRKIDAWGWRCCVLGYAGRAPLLNLSRTRVPQLPANARHRPRRWGPVPPWPWGPRALDPRSGPSLTSPLTT